MRLWQGVETFCVRRRSKNKDIGRRRLTTFTATAMVTGPALQEFALYMTGLTSKLWMLFEKWHLLGVRTASCQHPLTRMVVLLVI